MKKVLICFMTLVLLVTSVPVMPLAGLVSASASDTASVTVAVSESKVTVKINGVGTSGKANIVRMEANEYFSTDSLKGLSKAVSSGEIVGVYNCGTSEEISFSRYSGDLVDSLYSKYYIVQSGSVLYGPVYATEISAPVDSVYQNNTTKKGLYAEGDSYASELKSLGCSNTTVSFDFSQFVLPTEDRSGNSIDQSNNSNAFSYVSNGKTYYFSKSYIESVDAVISAYSRAGMNINLVVTASKTTDFTKYPYALVYTTANAGSYMAFNTSTNAGRGYFVAAMEFLADRYSRTKESGFVKNFVIGNEIDYTFQNYTIKSTLINKGITTLDEFMEEYSRTLRLANLAVKKYCKDMTVTVPLTHNWATSGYNNSDKNKNASEYFENSFAPKDIIDWLSAKTNARGGYDWAIAPSSSFSSLSGSDGTATDTGAKEGLTNLVTGDYNTTKVISYSNLELIEQYLKLDVNKFAGKTRDVHLIKAGISSFEAEKNSNANSDYEKQAAYLAYSYYKASLLDCIKSFSYYRYMDNFAETAANECFGLITTGKTKKPSYDVFRNMDRESSFEISNKYLPNIQFKRDGAVYSVANGNISSYKDTMKVVNTTYDWDSLWDESKIISTAAVGEGDLGLSLSKYVYVKGEDIKVTASAGDNAWVGIYKATDNVNAEQGGISSIYWYYVNKANNGKNHSSGNTYAIQKDGELNPARADLKDLPEGDYKVVLFKDEGYLAIDTLYISIVSKKEDYVKTNNTEYAYGEDVLVSAAAKDNSKAWVGIYKKGDTIGDVESVYWYYTDNTGAPVVLQNQKYNANNSIKSSVLTAGTYEIHLFKETATDSYVKLAKTEITVKAQDKPSSFKSMTYVLDNETDGFANGVVTVTLPGTTGATDCVLFWADDNGPLKGYTSLQAFKLTGRTTQYRMPTHTIIPPGATRLIAYGASHSFKETGEYTGFADTLSDSYVEVRLPEGSAYNITDDYLTEFQVVSDIHISSAGHTHNKHFKAFLEDVAKNSPKSSGIFVAGDIADNGYESQLKTALSLVQSVEGIPNVYLSMGNHDWYNKNPNKQFEKYIPQFAPDAKNNGKIYYDMEIDGNYYIFLGSDSECYRGVEAILSDAQLNWLKGKLEAYTAREPEKPIFILLHQSFYNTVSGSLPGEGWHGIVSEEKLANVLKGYNNVIMFNGHSHWVMDSLSNMHVGTEDRPTAFNTSSVAYLWSGYNTVTGQHQDGSEGYFIRTYDDGRVLVRGKDFVNGEYNPTAMYVVQPNKITTSQTSYKVAAGSEPFNLEASVLDKSTRIEFTSSDENVAIVDALGNVSVKNPGTAEISLYAAATDTKMISRQKITIEVTESTQEIIANSFVKTFGDADFAINARYNGTPTVTYTSDNEKVAVVSADGTVSIKGAGSANITIITSAIPGYNAASKVITVTVVKAEPEFSVSGTIDKSLGTAPFSLGQVLSKGDGALSYSSDNTKVAEVSSTGIITLKDTGKANITITAAASENYRTASTVVTVNVTSDGQIISVSDVTKAADTEPFSLGAVLEKGDGKLSYSVSDESVATVSADGIVTVKKAGVTDITVKASATSAYKEVSKTVRLTVTKADQIISVSDITKNVTDSAFSLGAKLQKGDGRLSYAVSDKNVAEISAEGVVTLKNGGMVTVTVVASGTDKYNSAEKTIVLTVNKGTQVISVADMVKTFSETAFSLGAKLEKGDGNLTYASDNEKVATVSSNGTVTFKGIGTANITVKAAETAKYAYAEKTVKLTVKKGTQIIALSDMTKTADVGSFALKNILKDGDGKLTYTSGKTSVATISSTGVITVKKVGTAKITVKAAATDNYNAASKTVTLTVKKASQVISASSVTKTIGDKSFEIGTLTKGNGKLTFKSSNTDVATVSKDGIVTLKAIGTAKITITASETSKYKGTSKTVKVTVKKKEKPSQTIKGASVTKTYGAKKFKLKVSLTKGNGKLTYKTSNKNVVTVSSKGYVTIKGVGYAYITVTASGTSKYKKTTKKILVKINPKAVEVKSLKKASSTSAKLTWKADKKVTGYIIEYSTSKKFTQKTTKKITVKGGSKTAKTIKGLKKGKKYFVRIRSYKNGSVKVYSSYKSLSIKM